MKSNNIKAMLVKAKISQKSIAEDLQKSRAHVSGVINGHHESAVIKKYIAEKLNRPYDKVWG